MKLVALKSVTIKADATAATTEPSYSASFSDYNSDGSVTAGDSLGALTGATVVSAVPALEGTAIYREVESLQVYNRDTASRTITVNKLDGATAYAIFAATLGAGESLSYDGRTWRVFTAAGEQKASTLGAQSSTAGTKNGTTVTANESGSFGDWHKTVLTCTATPISIADDAGVAQYGGVKLYDFPEGLIVTLGAVIDGAVTLGTTGTIINTWAGGIALGTVTATTGSTLTSTEADIMPEVDVAAATAKVAVVDGVSVATALTESGARWLDGTATAKSMFLNLVVDDDVTHTAGTGSFTGTVTIYWIRVGDK